MNEELKKYCAAEVLIISQRIIPVLDGKVSCATVMKDLYNFDNFLEEYGCDFNRRSGNTYSMVDVRLKAALAVSCNEAFGENYGNGSAAKYLRGQLSLLSNNQKADRTFSVFVRELIEMLEGSIKHKDSET